MRKVWNVLLCILLILGATLALFSCTTTALWRSQDNDTRGQETDIATVNGSAKYIVYAALDSNGNLIAYNANTAVASYAVVGYTGSVAELVIPSTYEGKYVTKVCVAAPYTAYKCYMDGDDYDMDDAALANNTIVTSIVFGDHVTSIAAEVCTSILNLATVTFQSTTSVNVGARAFYNCVKLQNIRFAAASATIGTNAFGECASSTPTYNYSAS